MNDRPWWMRRTRTGKMPIVVWLRLWFYDRFMRRYGDGRW